MQRIVAIVGVTASGKTDLGESLAESIGGEVVCADARQVFRDLDAGTGKPTPAARTARPHHLFDLLELGERPSAGGWARQARATCEAIAQRGGMPVLVGGSGLYLASLMGGLHDEPPHDAAVRERLRAEREALGPEALHARLAGIDPDTAARLAVRDGQRIVRALEVAEASGKPLSWWHAQQPAPPIEADWRVLELTCAPEVLAQRIDARTLAMFEGGLVGETRALIERGLEAELVALRAIGYDEAMDLIAGRISADDARARTNVRTRQLAKRQRTWFRHQVKASGLAAHDRACGPSLAAARAALGV